MVAQSLKINEGDTVLATEHEYGAVDRMWETICNEKRSTFGEGQDTAPSRICVLRQWIY